MLTRMLSLEQFSQRVSEKLTWPRYGWLEGSYETKEGTRNETQTTPKWSQIKPKTNPKKQKKQNQGKAQKGKTFVKIKQSSQTRK